ncbi:hypothetical protein AVEN_159134-1 [Araneus ventricosus]|uniref:Uncharacterized protein n=1 Tax=Araneus ventricosus TaxID=182803 RepID=A0A4Y2QL63_ARAVE|nr:hypothetical protein AVEN_159134-1 [Araneus ventricosus]
MLFKVFAFSTGQDGNLQALFTAPCPLHPDKDIISSSYIKIFIDDGVSSSSLMLVSSRLMSDAFSQASPIEQVHREEHIRPAFRQPQAFLHPFLQLQDVIFKRDSGAASLSILRREKPNRVGTQRIFLMS